MRVFIALPVPDQLDLAPLHEHPLFRSNMRPSHVEPHITLKPPQIIEDVSDWVNVATKALVGHAAMTATGLKIGFITPHTLALYLESEALSRLETSVASALAAYNSPEIHIYEGADYHPHVTIGRSNRTFSPEEQAELIQLAESSLKPYPTLELKVVRLYGHNGHRYEKLKDIELSGNS